MEWIVFALLVILAIVDDRVFSTNPYMDKKFEKQKLVYFSAAESMATGIKMWFPVVYFLLAERYVAYSRRGLLELYPLTLRLGLFTEGGEAAEASAGTVFGWVVMGLFTLLALVSFLLGLKAFLPHLRDWDIVVGKCVKELLIAWVYAFLLLKYNFFLVRWVFPKIVVLAAFGYLILLFVGQIKERKNTSHGYTNAEYEQELYGLETEREAERKRRNENRAAQQPAASASDKKSDAEAEPHLRKPDPRDDGRATMQDMPSVIRDSAGRTYHRTSYGGTPATYTRDEDYSTIAIYIVYQSESWWMNTDAGRFDIVQW